MKAQIRRKTLPEHTKKYTAPQEPPTTLENIEVIFKKQKKITVNNKQRTLLILEANKIFNDGNIEKARAVYSAIGYYDGLTKVARHYFRKGKTLEAYGMFLQAGKGAHKEIDEMSTRIASSISKMLKE